MEWNRLEIKTGNIKSKWTEYIEIRKSSLVIKKEWKFTHQESKEVSIMLLINWLDTQHKEGHQLMIHLMDVLYFED